MGLYLITGINGFIGSHVAKKILKEGKSLRGLIRKTSNLDFIKDLDIELIYGDISQPDTLDKAVEGVEKVIHIAGMALDWGFYKDFYRVNYQGTLNVAMSSEKARVKRFIHISSAAVHGFGFRNIDETYPMAGKLNSYGKTKKMAEEWLFEFARSTEMEITVLKPGNVYGPDDHTFIDKYLEAIYTGKIAYVNRGRALTCPGFIDNLVEGIWLACNVDGAAGEAFFITDGLEITWKEFTEKLAEALHVKKPRFSIPFSVGYAAALIVEGIFRAFRIRKSPAITRYRVCNGGLDYHLSIDKARKVLNYQTSVNLDQAVKRTVDWYLKEFVN